jgi:hypothetical protein
MSKITNDYISGLDLWGKIVYLKTDTEGEPRMITGIEHRKEGLRFGLTYKDLGETWHYEYEITEDKPIP